MLLDTTFLIDLQRELGGGKPRGASRYLNQQSAAAPWVSLISWMEFAEGYATQDEQSCRLFLSQFALVLSNAAIAWRASRISRRLREAGAVIGDHDIWIAATALEQGMQVVTRNPKYLARVDGLRVLTY
ncbi:MAG: type II toxin-antitoxin system VapC family toxin [Acidobacteria bacterium]|nr:type II toxin-antitoxin system VapC family toxin [Acidobacteriota bacterium]